MPGRFLGAALGTIALLAAAAVHAQYPARPVKLVVSFPPGGAPDAIGRVIGESLSPLLGQPVVLENRAGANGNIAMEVVARSAPDGYTLIICADSMIAVNPHTYAKMPLDTLKDLAPIASVAVSSAFFLSVHPSLPVKNFPEFIEYAKSANPPLAYSSGGNGSLHHLAMEMLKLRAGINIVHVPYRGGALAITATIAGDVPVTIASSVTGPHIRAGRLRGLAVTGSSRLPTFPQLPAIAEFYPGYRVSSWFGIFGPAGLPEPVLARLRSDINRAIATPKVRERLNAAGAFEPYATTPEEFASLIRADYEKFGKLVKSIGAKVD